MGRADLYPLVFAIVLSVVLLLLLQGVIAVLRKDERLHVAMAEGNVARAVLHAADFLSIVLMSAATVQSCVHGDNVVTVLLWGSAFGVTATLVYGVTSRLGMRAAPAGPAGAFGGFGAPAPARPANPRPRRWWHSSAKSGPTW